MNNPACRAERRTLGGADLPLVERDYYTINEALDLISARLPGENAFNNLTEAAHGQILSVYIIDERGIERPIPNTLWKASQLTRRLAFARLNDGIIKVPDGKRGIEGEARVNRAELDDLLPKS